MQGCATPSCSFAAHRRPQRGFAGFCCVACAEGRGHGPLCEQRPRPAQAAVPKSVYSDSRSPVDIKNGKLTVWGGLHKLPREIPKILLTAEEEEEEEQRPSRPLCEPIFQPDFVSGLFANVKRLDLTGEASDGVLRKLAAEGAPQLEVLVCARSPTLTDKGVLALAGRGPQGRSWDLASAMERGAAAASSGCARLKELNLVFCGRTSFESTLVLRKLLPSLRLVRRVPVFMEGHVQTPFKGEDGRKEVHSYYPDGSFSFSRPRESTGFLRELREERPGVVRNCLQYADFESGTLGFGWPEWVDLCFRVGVSVCRADGRAEEDDEAGTEGIFVLQAYGGVRSPARFPPWQAVQSVPAGKQVVVTRGGRVARDKDPTNQHPGCLMLSHMSVQPLGPEEKGPPRELLAKITKFLLGSRRWPAFKQRLVESAIHWELCGDEEDDRSWCRAPN